MPMNGTQREGIPSHFASEYDINWDFVAAYKRAEKEGRETPFIAWAEYTGECDYDAFDDAYLPAPPAPRTFLSIASR